MCIEHLGPMSCPPWSILMRYIASGRCGGSLLETITATDRDAGVIRSTTSYLNFTAHLYNPTHSFICADISITFLSML